MMAKTTKQLVITGRVQGVGLRYAMCDEAIRREINGWVKNMGDGSVHAVVQGEDEKVADIITWIEKSPGLSQVQNVRISDSSGDFHDFEIRYS